MWHSINARPATCVSLALENLLSETPDIVVSGSNHGENLGLVTYYSGTVGAAREAAFKGIPSIAVSVQAGSLNGLRSGGGVHRTPGGKVFEREIPPPDLH